jgi:hypothetical protein
LDHPNLLASNAAMCLAHEGLNGRVRLDGEVLELLAHIIDAAAFPGPS